VVIDVVVQRIKIEMPVVRQRVIQDYFMEVMEITLQKRKLELESSQLLEKLNSLPASEEIKHLRACLQALL
jgi:hypothetical protein